MVSDELISSATDLCKKYDQVSAYLLQRCLMIDLDTAEAIFNELIRVGLIINVRPHEYDKEAIVGDVNKKKLREMFIN